MIDIWGVTANSLWILGLAILLAELSWARWIAIKEKDQLRTVLRRPHARLILNLALFLFCSGLAASEQIWWRRILWGLLAAAWIVQAWLAWRDAHKMNAGIHRSSSGDPSNDAQ